ncbi:hypothetical protein FA95DRAFT_1560878 [Auriscalpium vulgare]|uniref:Uncharacterized protein n=1 Tax=Auriscalpium vulgare TaxID=40419 RepID=A0ACB8RQC7_9AGAM|nr:hypothetical protein FA95DRAFT_1560878 [Auriscalpium vulgare]
MCHDAAPQIWKDTLVLVLMITGICAAMALVGFLYAWYRSRTDKPSVETEQPSSGGRVVSDETSDSKEAILIEV